MTSTIAKIHCFNCANSFEYYFQTNKGCTDIKCPLCLVDMDRQTSTKLTSVLGLFDDINRELYRDSISGYGTPQFKFDLVSKDVSKSMKNN